MNFLVVGLGMLGQDLVEELKNSNNHVESITYPEIDITRGVSILDSFEFDILINCAAYTNVDGAETNKKECDLINFTGVKTLTDYCKIKNKLFLTISTDYVFSGEEKNYDETAMRHPINYYGLSKAKGEEYVENNIKKYYIVRTSWLFGHKGPNFVKTMIRLGSENEKLKIISDQVGCPTYTRDLAKSIIDLCVSKKEYGIYHITNSNTCSWHEFAEEILKNSDCILVPCSTGEYPLLAKRPKFSVLNNTKLNDLRNWKDALNAYKEEQR